jgi:Flp pilus assembly protein protease CpaA
MIFFGIGGHVLISLSEANIWPAFSSIAAATIFYIVALLMYHSGSWGGGDSKLLIGLGALLPTYPLLTTSITKIAPWPFILTLWLNIMIIGAFYTMFLITVNVAKHWKVFKINTKRQILKYKHLTLGVTCSILLPATLTIFMREFILLSVIWAFGILGFYLTLTTKALEKTCMYKKIDPTKLVEGDWVQDVIKVGNKTIFKPKRIGVEKKDIKQLIKLKEQGILNKVKVKDGFPYIPAFLIALTISITLGDIVAWIFNLLL